MKADVNLMEEAAARMQQLGDKINMICAQLNEVKACLKFSMQDNAMVTAAILASLSLQIRELDQRADGATKMYQVLQRAAEEYRICEESVSDQAQTQATFIKAGLKIQEAISNGFKTIPKETEQTVYQQYVIPFIKFEKRESL